MLDLTPKVQGSTLAFIFYTKGRFMKRNKIVYQTVVCNIYSYISNLFSFIYSSRVWNKEYFRER